MDDDNFIDDTGVDPAIGYGSGNEPPSPGSAPQVNIIFMLYISCEVVLM